MPLLFAGLFFICHIFALLPIKGGDARRTLVTAQVHEDDVSSSKQSLPTPARTPGLFRARLPARVRKAPIGVDSDPYGSTHLDGAIP